MPEWLIVVLAIVVGLAIVYAYLNMKARRDAATGSAAETERDYVVERESSRLGDMSDEDREWEAASKERNRKSQENDTV